VRGERYDGAEIDVDPGEHTFALEIEISGRKQTRNGSFTIASSQKRYRLSGDRGPLSEHDGGAADRSRDGSLGTVTCDTSAVARAAADAGNDVLNAGVDAGTSSLTLDHRVEPDADHLPSSGSVFGPVLLIGVGSALLVAGSVFGLRAMSGVDDAKSDPALCRQPGYQCTPLGTQVKADAEADAHVATGLFVGGGIVAAAGLLWLWRPWETTSSAPALNVSATPTRGGGVVSASGRF
jgi:hypothetical protein